MRLVFFWCSSLRIVDYYTSEAPQQQAGNPSGGALRWGLWDVWRGPDYGGLKAPIDGQMNQQGPPILLFIPPTDPSTGPAHGLR